MKSRSWVAALIAFLALLGAPHSWASDRGALVIGNGSYTGSAPPLQNPLNDALDVSQALTGLGFEVMMQTDLNLQGMETTIAAFINTLKEKSVALVYYSGHGVQIDGQNYLIPVGERIETASQVRSRGISLNDLLDRISDAGVGTLLVFLDSCRDNPFTMGTRDISRGLSVVAAPRVAENLIAYAAEPGTVALDGIGRNGTFTEAFLKNISVGKRSLADMMTNVRADVMERTGGKQRPRVDSGLVKPFYFITPEMEQARAKAEEEQLRKELDMITSTQAILSDRIRAAVSREEKDMLERERLTQDALESAKRVELANARQLSERLAQENTSRLAQQASMNRLAEAESMRLASLREEVEKRKKEISMLKPSDTTVSGHLRQIFAIKNSLRDISDRYDLTSSEMAEDIDEAFIERKKAIDDMTKYRWENDREFQSRKSAELDRIESERIRLKKAQEASLAIKREQSEQGLKEQMDRYRSSLTKQRFTVKGSNIKVVFGEFNTDRKFWPMTIESIDPDFLYRVEFERRISNYSNISAEFEATDKYIQAGAFTAEIDYQIILDSANEASWKLLVPEIRIVNLVDNSIERVTKNLPDPVNYKFIDSKIAFYSTLKFQCDYPLAMKLVPADSTLKSYSTTSMLGKKYIDEISSGHYTLYTKYGDDIDWSWSDKIIITPYEKKTIIIPKEAARYSYNWLIKKEEAKQAELSSVIQKKKDKMPVLAFRGWAGVGVGSLATVATVALSVFGFDTKSLYDQAQNSTQAKQYGDTMQQYGIAALVALPVAVISLAYGGMNLIATNPKPLREAEAKLQESINVVQALKMERLRTLDSQGM